MTGEIPWAIATGDFLGNGTSDLAVVNSGGNNVSILTAQLTQTATALASNVSIAGHGIHQIEASYAGDGNFTPSLSGTSGLTAVPTTPSISWPTPQPITYGTALSATQLNATASVAGTFSYSPAAGTVPGGGPQTLTTIFTPTDNLDYTTASSTVTLTVNKVTPTLTWAAPSPISYGTTLSNTLNAIAQFGTSTLPGTFAFTATPSGGTTSAVSAATILAAGSYSLTVTFTPTAPTDFTTAEASVTLVVNKTTPTINWNVPSAITYGSALGATQLNASAWGSGAYASTPVSGSFVYSPASGTVLGVGSQTLSTTFTPSDTKDYTTAMASVKIVVNQATPVINWAAPVAITYGTALSTAELNASSTVAGSFHYSPAAGTVLTSGSQTLSVTFTPNNTVDYTTAAASVTLLVNQAAPTITWATPAAITYGTALSATQLDATASVPGTFSYSSLAGTILNAGQQPITVTFTPNDTKDYKIVADTVDLTVNQATPTITWATPAAITYGTALSATQLDATASVPGTFSYSSPAGTILTAGGHNIKATFTPTDSTDYKIVTDTISLIVTREAPTITWATPSAITYGTALSATQLDATTSAPGNFVYSAASGSILTAGSHTVTVFFYPTDESDYAYTTAKVTLQVNKATPTIMWTAPSAITYGTALTSTQLNAIATGSGTYASTKVSGSFVYSPALGTVPGAGLQTLSTTFNPSDTADYTSATASVALTVNQATPAITWATPAAITYGAALGSGQLNATSPVAGTFTYSPTAGTVPGVGQQILKATFTPKDTTDYASTTASVTLTVNEATPTITWATPAAITYGAGLGSAELNATSSVAGSFTYSPVSGTVLGAGRQTLTATFTPTNTADYKTATATVTLTVNKAMPEIAWAAPTAIIYGTALSAAQLDATASVPGSFVYTPASGATPPVGNDTLSATFTPIDNVDYATATATVTLTVTTPPNPVPFLGNMSPAIANAGGATFTITVNGAGFLANSTVYWGTTALTTKFVSATQLTATVPAADIAIAGATAVNVRTPAPGGGTSDILQFEIDSPSGTATSPTVSGTVVTVTSGSPATYSISFPASVTNATASCLNLPAGALCSYSSATKVLTITTASTTPTGTYQVTVVFAETVSSTSAAGILLPFLLAPLYFLRRKLASRAMWSTISLSLILLAVAAFSIGCGGSGSGTTTTTQSVTSSAVVGINVQ